MYQGSCGAGCSMLKKMLASPPGSLLSRRRFLKFSGLAAGLGLAAYSGLLERHHLELVEQTIRIRRLPPSFTGWRIAQISDIHYDEFTEPYFLREVIRRLNALTPDLVVLTGDFVSYGPLPPRVGASLSYPCAEILSGIACPHRFASLGNHDAVVGGAIVADALRVHGIPTLLNSAVAIERGGSRIWLAGIRSSLEDRADLQAAVPQQAAAGEPVILLAHEPDYAPQVLQHGAVDLMLSGHTHGGQVRLPFVGTPRRALPPMGRRFVEGHFELGTMQLYVNRGIGTVGLPVRFNCPPELTLLTLEPA
jgi:predicted MPP superfamily phosphohydrolase